jgi:low temperature requirement protein LtrA
LSKGAEREREHSDEHQVKPPELFFSLVFVFAITQVTRLLTNNPTWGESWGARARGGLVGMDDLRVVDER